MVGFEDVRTTQITKYNNRTLEPKLLTSNLDGVTFRVVVAPLEEKLLLSQCHADDVGQRSITNTKQLS